MTTMPAENGLTVWSDCQFSKLVDFNDGHGVPQTDSQMFGCQNTKVLGLAAQKSHFFKEGLIERTAILCIGKPDDKRVAEALGRICGSCVYNVPKISTVQQQTY